jgi:hypothetical protein
MGSSNFPVEEAATSTHVANENRALTMQEAVLTWGCRVQLIEVEFEALGDENRPTPASIVTHQAHHASPIGP